MKQKKTKILFAVILAAALVMAGCGKTEEEPSDANGPVDTVPVYVFAAASLGNVMAELEKSYEAENPGADIMIITDSSGALLAQIQEGAPCDVFFSAAQKQMDELEAEGMLIDGTRKNVVNNQLVVITQPDSETKVTGLSDIAGAGSIALADGSVPAGRYTRQAMINLGMLREADDPADITTAEVSEQLGGTEISEQGNVSKVLTAVEEGSCEVGTVYLSDTSGHEDRVKILETVSRDLTGDIIYPVAGVVNKDADEAETAAAADFITFLTSDDAKALYRQYGFDTEIE